MKVSKPDFPPPGGQMTSWGDNTGVLILGIALIGGALFGLGDREVRIFERVAAADIASRLQGEGKQISVNVRTGGLESAWGDLPSATITAKNFSL